MGEATRTCHGCGREKPIAAFEYVRRSRPTRSFRRARCRGCQAKVQAAYEARRARETNERDRLIELRRRARRRLEHQRGRILELTAAIEALRRPAADVYETPSPGSATGA